MTDLRTAQEVWLNRFGNSSLSPAMQAKSEQLRQALDDADAAKAWATVNSMRAICAQLQGQHQQAETLLGAGRAAFELGDYQQAKSLLEESVKLYDGDQHSRAVAKWMLGYVLWNIDGQHENAIVAWQSSLGDFNWLYRRPFPPDGELFRGRVDWYQVRVGEMQQALDECIDLDELPPRLQPRAGVEDAQPAPGPEAADQPPAPAPEEGPADARPVEEPPAPAPMPEPGLPAPDRPPGRVPRIQPGFLEGFSVVEAVALDPNLQPVGVDPHTDEEMTIEQVTIQEQAFGVYNPYGSGSALRLTNRELGVVRVYGDSMNNAGIEDGDYALVRYQDNARNGDIVVAEFDDEDTRATLKRYRRVSKDLVQLISESTEDYPVREFSREDKGFTIRGKVLAIFKKQ